MAQSIGRIFPDARVAVCDPATHAHTVRLTDAAHICHHVCPSMRSTTSDGRFLLHFRQIGNRRQLCALNLSSGRSLQLTSGADVHGYRAAFSADNRQIYYLQDNAVWRMDDRDMLRQRAYVPEDGWVVREFDLSHDDRFMVLVEIERKWDSVTIHSADWSTFSLNAMAAPHCRLVYADMELGSRSVVVDTECWLARPSICPRDSTTILFCHEGPYDLVDARMWLVNSDGSDCRACCEQKAGTVLTSEFWMPDGQGVGFLRWAEGDAEHAQIRVIDPETLEERTLAECGPLAHCSVSPDGRFAVGDVLGTNEPLHLRGDGSPARRGGSCEAASGELDDFIYLVDLKTGERHRLCRHGSSCSSGYGAAQDAVPYPLFSRDGHSVIYTSDASGMPSVHRVDLVRFLWEREAADNESLGCGLASTF